MYKAYGKRIFDVVIAAIGLIILSPLLLFTGVIIILVDRSFPVFVQYRPGFNEKIFRIFKFQTMTQEFDSAGELLPDEMRVTSLGRFLRKYSIDELPQLWNVLSGEMSLVGPRPLLIDYLPLYTHIQRKRHTVQPGITGWAQVNGRNTITFEKKLELDIWYADNMNFCLDAKILLLTFMNIVRGSK
jgi:undecaprenyl phosphate N,N'-diacetylbacillosamine 1-phosphate transferase